MNKKITALLFATIISISGVFTAFASNQNVATIGSSQTSMTFEYNVGDKVVNDLRSGSAIIGAAAYDGLTLGNIIPTYYWDGESFTAYEDAYYFPAYSNGQIVGVALVADPQSSEPKVSFGKRFASELNSAVQSAGEDYFLVVNGTQTFFYSKSAVKLLEEIQLGLKPFVESDEPDTRMQEGEPESSIASEPTISRKLCTDFTETQVKEGVSANMAIFSYNMDLRQRGILRGNIDITPKERATDYKLLNVGNVNQQGTKLCWACATQLAGSYVSGNYGYNFWGIAEILGIDPNDGGNNLNIIDGLRICFGVTGQSKGYYIYENVKWFIDRGRPIIAQCYPGPGIMGHTVTICGYYNNYSRIIISESDGAQAGAYVYYPSNADGSFDLYYGGTAYHWTKSVTVQ